jgi:4-hydroxy-tetrahydrodipicolinate synthase
MFAIHKLRAEHVLDFAKSACDAGADGLLAVTPYYNKATQGGLIKHFSMVADVATVPLIMYNVPSRTGCNLLPDTVSVLADHPMISGLKEASGNMGQIVEIAAKTRGRLDLYSGDDGLTVPLMSVGGIGCISVLSNVAPRLATDICDKFFAGDIAGAGELQCRLLPLIDLLFCEVNPIPVKAAMKKIGFDCGQCRLPLSNITPENQERLDRYFKQ